MRLISEWRVVIWRSATSWVATILGALLGTFAAHWGIMFAVVPFLPFYLQLPVAASLGVFFVGGPVILARITEQPKMAEKVKEASDVAP